MTIEEYMKKINKISANMQPGFAEMVMQTVSVWDNGACKGYALKAMENAGISEEQIKAVSVELSALFNDWTIEEAAAYFNGTC